MMDDRDLESTMPVAEREALVRLGDQLERERPVPGPAFRGELRRHLLASRRRVPSPARDYRLWAVSYVGFGALCLTIAALGLVGTGPFAA